MWLGGIGEFRVATSSVFGTTSRRLGVVGPSMRGTSQTYFIMAALQFRFILKIPGSVSHLRLPPHRPGRSKNRLTGNSTTHNIPIHVYIRSVSVSPARPVAGVHTKPPKSFKKKTMAWGCGGGGQVESFILDQFCGSIPLSVSKLMISYYRQVRIYNNL